MPVSSTHMPNSIHQDRTTGWHEQWPHRCWRRGPPGLHTALPPDGSAGRNGEHVILVLTTSAVVPENDAILAWYAKRGGIVQIRDKLRPPLEFPEQTEPVQSYKQSLIWLILQDYLGMGHFSFIPLEVISKTCFPRLIGGNHRPIPYN